MVHLAGLVYTHLSSTGLKSLLSPKMVWLHTVDAVGSVALLSHRVHVSHRIVTPYTRLRGSGSSRTHCSLS